MIHKIVEQLIGHAQPLRSMNYRRRQSIQTVIGVGALDLDDQVAQVHRSIHSSTVG